MKSWTCGIFAILGLISLAAPRAAGPTATVSVKSGLDQARPSETIVLSADAVRKALAVDDVRKVHVQDERAGRDLLTQAVDLDDDGKWDQVLFQADLGPTESRTFLLSVGERRIPQKDDFKAYGRFVRERRDDFAWENDLVAHRMYGTALETWAQEPLTSSAVDVWVKRVHRLVINDWYMVDDYHRDTGEGADLYSAGKSRGCGGNGIWQGGQLYPSANFHDSRVLANGPIRVMFELTYPAWEAAGAKVSEVKRISLDAGQRLNRFESRYTTSGGALQHAAGIKKNPESQVAVDKAAGILRTWESFRGDGGHLGCGVIVAPGQIVDAPASSTDYLLVAKVPADGVAVYHAGSAWDRGSDVPDVAAWDRYLASMARRIGSPLEVSISAR
jgi:hypothetical protein